MRTAHRHSAASTPFWWWKDRRECGRIPIREWYTGPGKTVRKHDEILTAIKIKKESYEGFGGHYIKYGKRKAMEIADPGLCGARKAEPG